jgi:hypothetical protein
VKTLTLLLLFSLAFAHASVSQQVTNTTGATIRNANYTVEYSVGEVAITTLTAANNDVTQGVLQPNLKVQSPGCDMINGALRIFESPSKDKLRLVGIHDWIDSYQVFASDGRLILYKKYYNNHLDISGLPAAGIYFIRLLPGCNGQYKVLKFMKR